MRHLTTTLTTFWPTIQTALATTAALLSTTHTALTGTPLDTDPTLTLTALSTAYDMTTATEPHPLPRTHLTILYTLLILRTLTHN